MSSSPKWIVNLSLLFTELPLTERPRAAVDAGFDEFEFWWPFGDDGRPSDAQVEEFIRSVEESGGHLHAMNLFAGDMPAGDRGVLSYPERVDEFHDSVAVAVTVADRLGTRFFNAPYGHRRDDLDPLEQDELADRSLVFAANELAKFDGKVLLEPLSGMPRYPLKSSADGFAVIDRIASEEGVQNIGLLVDQYHLMSNGEDIAQLVLDNPGRVDHVQIADVPGRGEPGSGDSADGIAAMIAALVETGYAGVLALEYFPTTDTESSLATWRASFPSG